MNISFSEKTINGSPIKSAFVFRERLSVIRTADGERYLLLQDAVGNPGFKKLDDSILKSLTYCETKPVYVVGQDLSISDINRIGQKKDKLMCLFLFVPASLDMVLSDITRKLMIDSIARILSAYKDDEDTVACLEKIIANKVPRAADIQGAISYAESLREKGALARTMFESIQSNWRKEGEVSSFYVSA